MPDGIRLTQIDETNIGLHPRLTPADQCLFLFEYTSGRKFDHSATNQLIFNIKKKPGANGQNYKVRDMRRCSEFLRATLNPEWLKTATLVPVPPSKGRGDPAYDVRMETICRGISPNLDVRSIILQTTSRTAAHEAGANRPSVEQVLADYVVDEASAHPAPKVIGIFDDVLTAGTHFRAMEVKLHQRWPGVPIWGIFIARRVYPTEDFTDWPADG